MSTSPDGQLGLVQLRADGARYIECPICNRVVALLHALAPVFDRWLHKRLAEHVEEQHARKAAA